MGSQLDAKAIVSLYEILGRDKSFIIGLANIYRLQGEEFLMAVAEGVGAETLAGLAHRLAGSSSRLDVADFVNSTLALETNLRTGQPHREELGAVLSALPEIMEEFETKARGLPEDDR